MVDVVAEDGEGGQDHCCLIGCVGVDALLG